MRKNENRIERRKDAIMKNDKKIDKEKIEAAVKEILVALGENVNREGLQKTPSRVAKMFCEVFEGINYSNDEIAEMFNVTFEDELSYEKDNIVMLKDIETFSFCEHHMALMYNMKISVAYIPKGKVIGLSKIVRICDMVCKRLQIQERIGEDIAYILNKVTESEDIAVIINATHSCISMRGIRNPATRTTTIYTLGRFRTEESLIKKLELLTNK